MDTPTVSRPGSSEDKPTEGLCRIQIIHVPDLLENSERRFTFQICGRAVLEADHLPCVLRPVLDDHSQDGLRGSFIIIIIIIACIVLNLSKTLA